MSTLSCPHCHREFEVTIALGKPTRRSRLSGDQRDIGVIRDAIRAARPIEYPLYIQPIKGDPRPRG